MKLWPSATAALLVACCACLTAPASLYAKVKYLGKITVVLNPGDYHGDRAEFRRCSPNLPEVINTGTFAVRVSDTSGAMPTFNLREDVDIGGDKVLLKDLKDTGKGFVLPLPFQDPFKKARGTSYKLFVSEVRDAKDPFTIHLWSIGRDDDIPPLLEGAKPPGQ